MYETNDRLEKILVTELQKKPRDTPNFAKLKRLLLQRAAVENQRRALERALFWFTVVSIALSVAAVLWLKFGGITIPALDPLPVIP